MRRTCFHRTATKREILRSYRKLAVKWHPDQYKEADKAKAEKMFIDIAAAKEVLSDPGKEEIQLRRATRHKTFIWCCLVCDTVWF